MLEPGNLVALRTLANLLTTPGTLATGGERIRQAQQLFEGMGQQRFIAMLCEVAALGQSGLQINEPGNCFTLMTLPATWCDLALTCLIHVGMKRLTLDQDSGLGI